MVMSWWFSWILWDFMVISWWFSWILWDFMVMWWEIHRKATGYIAGWETLFVAPTGSQLNHEYACTCIYIYIYTHIYIYVYVYIRIHILDSCRSRCAPPPIRMTFEFGPLSQYKTRPPSWSLINPVGYSLSRGHVPEKAFVVKSG